MIDIENLVVDAVSNAVQDEYADAVIYSSHNGNPASMPCVMVYEVGNSEKSDMRTADGVERFADISYSVEVFANGANKKQVAKDIFKIVDDTMRSLVKDSTLGISSGFNRIGRNYVFNTSESTVFVCAATYNAMVGESPSGAITFYRK